MPLHALTPFRQRFAIPAAANAAAVMLVVAVIVLAGSTARQVLAPVAANHATTISLAPTALPSYTLRTVMRMFAALLASLLFTFIYGTCAAKSRRLEMVLVPLLDVLQSVPVLGYLSFTVVFFLSLYPNSMLGAELASVFAIFTAQAWNMAFSFYQSLRTIPTELSEVSRSLRQSAWQRFWRLEVPFAMPGLIWNTMMSMSGSWFFVVASEAIAVGNTQISLPGIGSYVQRAIEARDLGAIVWAIVAMSLAIVIYDQLLFRPLVVWADKFRVEQTAGAVEPRSWLQALLGRSTLVGAATAPIATALHQFGRARLALPRLQLPSTAVVPRWLVDTLWYAVLAAGLSYMVWRLLSFVGATFNLTDIRSVVVDGGLTTLRVIVLIMLASVVWVPIGVLIGLSPRLTELLQPAAQFLAAFPANLLFPLAVYLIVHLRLAPDLWLSPLMILGTQWYILFNVIAGASAFPRDLQEVAGSLRLRAWKRWLLVLLPGVFPFYVTGAITASGGAWNASIVSETVSWGSTRLSTHGLGAYIAERTTAGDYARIALGVAVMSVIVVLMNRLIWRPLYALAEHRTRLD
jgi:NitT/TauT family transport system permease protein